ncbi:hypothetical protein [Methylovirgula ligni]|nr:hypothetical protein [Methylovirgula ligni]
MADIMAVGMGRMAAECMAVVPAAVVDMSVAVVMEAADMAVVDMAAAVMAVVATNNIWKRKRSGIRRYGVWCFSVRREPWL